LHSSVIELRDLPPFRISRTAHVRGIDEEVRRYACLLKQRKSMHMIRPKAIVERDRDGWTRTVRFSVQQFVERDYPYTQLANHRELRPELLCSDAISSLLFSGRVVT
jgi:hypothetical protein